jgi:hypothetical protein
MSDSVILFAVVKTANNITEEILFPKAEHTALGERLSRLRSFVLSNEMVPVNEYRWPVDVPVEQPVPGPSGGSHSHSHVFPENHLLLGDIVSDGRNKPRTEQLWPVDVSPLCDALAVVAVTMQARLVAKRHRLAQARLVGAGPLPDHARHAPVLRANPYPGERGGIWKKKLWLSFLKRSRKCYALLQTLFPLPSGRNLSYTAVYNQR